MPAKGSKRKAEDTAAMPAMKTRRTGRVAATQPTEGQTAELDPAVLRDIIPWAPKAPSLTRKQWLERKPELAPTYPRMDEIKIDFTDTLEALRPALVVMANQTLAALEASDTWHMEGENLLPYQQVLRELKGVRDVKIAAIKRRTTLAMEQSRREYEYDRVFIQCRYEDKVLRKQEKTLAQIQCAMVNSRRPRFALEEDAHVRRGTWGWQELFEREKEREDRKILGYLQRGLMYLIIFNFL